MGHLIVVGKVMMKANMPPKAHNHWLPYLFLQQYPELAGKGILYLDLWPIVDPMIALYHPDLLAQLDTGHFAKHKMMQGEFGPITGGIDLVSSGGQVWKKSRSMFNPGFSAKNVLTLVPTFLEDIKQFKQNLTKAAASGEVVLLENLTTGLAIDLIGRATL